MLDLAGSSTCLSNCALLVVSSVVMAPIRFKSKKPAAVENIPIDVSGSEDEAYVQAAADNDARAKQLLAVVPTSVPATDLITVSH